MTEEKRLFVALPLSQEWRDILSRYPSRVSFPEKDVRWADAENLHITAHFLGNVPAVSVPQLCGRLERALAAVAPFSLAFKDVTYAPPRGKITMIWAQCAKNQEFTQLVRAITKTARVFVHNGREKILPPLPHITLARFRRPIPQHPRLPYPAAETLPALSVSVCILMESVLSRGGPRYHPVASFSL